MDPRLSLPDAVAHAQRVERLGYDGLHVAETVHDAHGGGAARGRAHRADHRPHQRRPRLHRAARRCWPTRPGTSAKLSGGRFELGLGTQIRQNIEDRYAVPFGEDPIARLGDYVGAVRAAFASFASGEAPVLREPALPRDPDAAVLQPGARRRDGGAADLPRRRAAAGLRAGRRRGRRLRQPPHQLEPALPARDLPARPGRGRPVGRAATWAAAGFETVIGTSVITGGSDEAVLAERERQRRLLAFLYSTPAYAPTLELYGWAELGPAPARPDPPRPLGRPGRRALRRGARHAGPLRHLRRAARPPARPLRGLGPGHRRLPAGRRAATTRPSAPSWRRCGRAEAASAGLSAAWGR